MLSTKADSVRLYKIRKVISELSGKEGRGTELVSLYIPPKKPSTRSSRTSGTSGAPPGT